MKIIIYKPDGEATIYEDVAAFSHENGLLSFSDGKSGRKIMTNMSFLIVE